MRLKSILICAFSIVPFIFCPQASADEVIFDDLIVGGSLCVGLDCVIEEVFDFDTVKLKSADPQIRFEDTSSSANFPSSDWTMGVEDSLTDTSLFYIKDANADTTVLKMSASPSGGVALGAGSDLEDNVVSVGSAGAERRITHVAEGIELSDAVNVGQFTQFQDDVNAELTSLEAQMDEIVIRIEDLVDRLDNL